MTSSGHRGGTTLLALFSTIALLAIAAASADAADFCVGATGANCPVGATSYAGDAAGLNSAIAATLVSPASTDKIYLQSGTYADPSGWSLGAGNNVSLIGVGPSKPVLQASSPAASDAALSSSGGSIAISNIALEAPAVASAYGINANLGSPTIKDVDITGAGSTQATGISLVGQGATIQRVNIDLPFGSGGSPSTGIRATSATSLLLADVTVALAYRGIELTNATNNVVVQRVDVQAADGIVFSDSWGVVSSSLVKTPAASTPNLVTASGIRMVVSDGTDYTAKPVSVFNDTVAGNGTTPGAGITSSTSLAGSTARVDVDSTAVTGHGASFLADPVSSSTADLLVGYSRYDLGSTTVGAALGTQASAFAGDPLFANAAGGDYNLQKNSQLVDAGNPASIGGSNTDLAGNQRVVSRGAGNIRDIGAYEAPNNAPTPVISISSAQPTTTAPVQFSGAGSTDADGDAMSYAWKIDSGAFATGITASRIINSDGLHTVELTVTDSTGAAASASTQFIVAKGVLDIKLPTGSVRVSKSGAFSIKLGCPDIATSNCTGKLLFKTTKKSLKAAQYVFSIEPGTTRKLSIQSYKTFQKRLKKEQKTKVRATLSGSTGNATLGATPRTMTFIAPKK